MDIYRIISELEYNSAATYLRLKDNELFSKVIKSRLEGNEDMFDYMIRESYRNAKKVEASGWDYKFPVVDEVKIEDLERNIKETLQGTEDLVENDIKQLFMSLAASEMALSQIYEIASDHFDEMSRYFQRLSQKFDQLARVEKSHSKMIEPLIHRG